MAVTVTKNLTDLYNAESTSSWTTDDTVSTYTGFQREGTYCLGMQGSQGTVYAYKTITSVNLSNTIIYSWLNAGSVDTQANGGFRIVVGDGTNRIAYYVGGSDDYGFQIGAWSCFLLDTSNPPTNYATLAGSEASLNFGNITQVGVQFNVPIKAVGSGDNAFFDVCRYISNSSAALTIGGGGVGTEGTFEEIATDDASTSSGKAYGVIRKLQTGVYGVQGAIEFGDGSGTSSTYFKDTDSIVIFEDRSIPSTYYNLSVAGNSTGTNSFILGNKVGGGDTAVGSNGCTIQSAGPGVKIDLSDTNFNEVKIYGSKFLGINNGILLNSNTAHEFIGNIVDQSGQIDPKQTIIRNCTFSGTTDNNNDGSALLWNSSINIKNCSLNANTDATNDPHAIEHTSAGTFTYDNLSFSGNDYDIENSGSSAAVTINATNGSNPSTHEETGTPPGTTTINNAVTLTATVKDESNPISGATVGIFKSNHTDVKGAVADDGGSQTDETTAATNATANDMTLLPATPTVNDAYYFGSQDKFWKLELVLGTSGAGTWTITWEYYNGTGWSAISSGLNDETDGFTASAGTKYVSFDVPTDWATTTVKSISAYWIRARVSAYTSITTQPLGTQAYTWNVLMNKQTNASGIASETYNYPGTSVPVNIRVRKSSTGTTRYFPISTTGTISGDFSVELVMTQDEIAQT